MSDGRAKPIFDVASYARLGPGRRERLSQPELDQIRRTVARAPEVMVKVLSGGKPTAKGARQHLEYVGREGELDIETDEGERLTGQAAAQAIVDDWDLDLEEGRPGSRLASPASTRHPKLVHKLVFSMPPGTPPDKVLNAVKSFAREEFALKHRYAMVLHTDDDHPHVHVIVKAVSEQGERLNIRKDTLRRWREDFAHQLRAQGVEANATNRAARGRAGASLKDGIYRAALRGESSFLRKGHRDAGGGGEPGAVQEMRRRIGAAYQDAARLIASQGDAALSDAVRGFAKEISAPVLEASEAALVRGRVPTGSAARKPTREPPKR